MIYWISYKIQKKRIIGQIEENCMIKIDKVIS